MKQALCEPDRELFLEQRTEWERLVIDYIGWKIENRIVEEDDPLIDFYFKLVKFANLLTEEGDEFAHLIEQHARRPQAEDLLQGPVALPRQDLRLRARHGRALRHARAVRLLSQAPRLPERSHDGALAAVAVPAREPQDRGHLRGRHDVQAARESLRPHRRERRRRSPRRRDGNFLALFPSYAFLREVSERMPPIRKNVMVQRTDMTDYERNAILDILRDRRATGI